MATVSRLEEAQSLSETSPSKAEAIYKHILNTPLGAFGATSRSHDIK
jgi:hypothetical protein